MDNGCIVGGAAAILVAEEAVDGLPAAPRLEVPDEQRPAHAADRGLPGPIDVQARHRRRGSHLDDLGGGGWWAAAVEVPHLGSSTSDGVEVVWR